MEFVLVKTFQYNSHVVYTASTNDCSESVRTIQERDTVASLFYLRNGWDQHASLFHTIPAVYTAHYDIKTNISSHSVLTSVASPSNFKSRKGHSEEVIFY